METFHKHDYSNLLKNGTRKLGFIHNNTYFSLVMHICKNNSICITVTHANI